ncbi:adenine deaminase [Vallitalea longa]|uniref:Adenine deaminase n=1 Tax=Vallitalea longa TaxID=2936439 RepID=A0A9W5Y9X7_9FIRM|nr:adenine deaminase [Vallitalea longa]GKX30022.1 adenine deaminase [Vallitalea longa]
MSKVNKVKVARGDKKAELVLKDCNIVNVFNCNIERADIAIEQGVIVGVGEYEGIKEIDVDGRYVCPGFIDGHVHIESSLLTPPGFAQLVVAKGTTTVIEDPHEIANVCGLDGIDYMLKASEKLPLDVLVMLPSCVPSTNFENSGAVLLAEDLGLMKDKKNILGLGEVMNYPDVISGNKYVYDKLELMRNRIIDGHAPNVLGKRLNAYVTAGVMTDHECTKVEELEEKVSKGMYVHIREGSATRNLEELIRGVTPQNSRRILFCTDDKQAYDIENEGHINYNVKLAIKKGINPVTAIQMATINTAECYGLKGKGAIAPGYDADILILSHELKDIAINEVYKKGKLVAKNDKPLFDIEICSDPRVLDTVKIDAIDKISLEMPLKSSIVKVIQLIEHNIITKNVTRKVDVENDCFKYNSKLDILKLAVIERHKGTGNVGLGLVEGYGLKGGAVALTIAHDSHNIISIGDNDNDMKVAVKELKRVKGGITICAEGKVLKTLPLEVGGLMTNSSIKEVGDRIKEMNKIAITKGVNPSIDPFLTLAFLALPVIPELKLTDCGLFDVDKFSFVDIEE